jgi:acetyltransferase
VLDWAEPNGIGFSHIVGIGGNADIGFGPVLDWLSRDPGTGAILLDIRHLKNRRAFLSAARAASRLRPVVAIRPGTLLADPGGDAERVEAALRRAGAFSVTRLEDSWRRRKTLTRARLGRNAWRSSPRAGRWADGPDGTADCVPAARRSVRSRPGRPR